MVTFRIVKAQDPPSREETGHQNSIEPIGIPPIRGCTMAINNSLAMYYVCKGKKYQSASPLEMKRNTHCKATSRSLATDLVISDLSHKTIMTLSGHPST
ncbi:hypothetical protein TNCV_1820301 [Trichonephila clavipes]|nr:hypothetical protein TNCV_1820301 [Trichonephila clavipes]